MKKLVSWCAEQPGYILAFCSGLFLLLGWGQDGINLDSATYATIARNMAEHDSWFYPHYTDFYISQFAEHPPLVMWVQGLIFLIAEPNDSTARLFGALCTVGSVLTAYLIGKEVADKQFGFLSGLILLLTYNFMQIGNSTLLDVPMTFFVMATLLGIIRIWKEGISAKLALFTGTALSLAWLSKGVVTAPVWIAFIAVVLVWNRKWLKDRKFYLIPSTLVVVIGLHFFLDQLFNAGYFARQYFLDQIAARFLGSISETGSNGLQFTIRYLQLYLPFVLLIPFGVYLIIKEKTILLYPILIALVSYILLYSVAPKLYYHYIAPLYALSAPIAAWPLYKLLPMNWVRKISIGFLIAWVLAVIGVTIAGVKIHEIRTPEIYSIKDEMNEMLSGSSSRHGLTIGRGRPDWDRVAKTAWYWRSDILRVNSAEEALERFQTGEFAYILTNNRQKDIENKLLTDSTGLLEVALKNEKVTVSVKSTTERLKESPDDY